MEALSESATTRDSAVLHEHSQSTPSALHLRTGIRFDDWLGMGRQLSRISSASAWWLGDWLVYGQSAYRQRYRTAVEATSFDYQTLRNYAWVARRVEMSRRRDKLSFQHHAEVASLCDAQQDVWLLRAERLEWSRNEMRRQLKGVGRPSRGALENGSVVLRLQIPVVREQRWRAAASAADRDLVDWIASAIDDAAQVALSEPRATVPARGVRHERERFRPTDPKTTLSTRPTCRRACREGVGAVHARVAARRATRLL